MAVRGKARPDDEELGTDTAKMGWNELGRYVSDNALVTRDGHVRDSSIAVAEDSDWLAKRGPQLHRSSVKGHVGRQRTPVSLHHRTHIA